MKTLKSIMIIGEGDNKDHIINQLSTMGWTVSHVGCVKQAFKKARINPPLVGLIFIESSHSILSSEIQNLINESSTRWTAIVDKQLLSDKKICQVIGQLFCAYHTLPIDPKKLHFTLETLLEIAQLTVSPSCQSEADPMEYKMVGNSPIMKALFKTIHKVAVVDAPVFIQGESGTGKELTARAIHEESRRADNPFNAVNCGALPSNLIQSELFGHEKGAFTGASQRKIGIIENTQGGTLFLDEVGDLPLELQVNLLRFLENHTIQRVGGLKEIEVDVRVLAATHVDLENAVEEGSFREDLYHRLNVLQVRVPALRLRGDDIEILAQHFFNKFANEKSLQVTGFNKESLALMRLYEWPGNIRELINRVRRAMVMCDHHLIRPADLGLERRHCASRHAESLEEARDIAERGVVQAALARNSFNIQHAARELGISRVTLYRLMEKHKITRASEAPSQKGGLVEDGTSRDLTNVLHFSSIKKGPS
ncbi:sigma-54 dependent transcriptional regulator [Halomonas nitroreducens]|uniref:Sigma-54-dependent Fis family transcriptional regulator n=1 Tax=Halomonas nitroreducens TaxID=447425 RepID=A0A431V787_9GAMM|nr:sigma-54 dependent transcriptional regulator [Halomonas nitroreducens]RTR05649.1 sigma-54-dependent Fis family transcriptional regulator [Halomonas nitroreducens]